MTLTARRIPRRVAVIEADGRLPSGGRGVAITDPAAPRTDVAVAVVRPEAPTVGTEETLRRAAERADCLVVVVVGPATGPHPDLAGLREVADVITHVGADEQAVADIVAALGGGAAGR